MVTTLITKQLLDRDLSYQGKGLIIDPSDVNSVINTIRDKVKDELIVYDITRSTKDSPRQKLRVNDHINRTGINPLIGRQAALGVDFTDLTDLYGKTVDGIVTNCLGDRFREDSFEYPSAWLCNISIIARALNVKKISAFLVNIPTDGFLEIQH